MKSNYLKKLNFKINEQLIWPSLEHSLLNLKKNSLALFSEKDYQKLETILDKENYLGLQQYLLENTTKKGIKWINNLWEEDIACIRKNIIGQTKIAFSYSNKKLNTNNKILKAAIMIKLISEQYLFYFKNKVNSNINFFCAYKEPNYEKDNNYVNHEFNEEILLMYNDYCFLLKVINNNQVISINEIYHTLINIIKKYHQPMAFNFHYFDYGLNRDQVAITLKAMLEDYDNLIQFNRVKNSIALITIDESQAESVSENLHRIFIGNNKKINKWFGKGLIINITNNNDVTFLIEERFFNEEFITNWSDNLNNLLDNLDFSINEKFKVIKNYQHLIFNIAQYEQILLKYQKEHLNYYNKIIYNECQINLNKIFLQKENNLWEINFLIQLSWQVAQLKTLKKIQNNCLKLNINNCWGLKTKSYQLTTNLTKTLSYKIISRNLKAEIFWKYYLLATNEYKSNLDQKNNYSLVCHLWILEKIYQNLLAKKIIKRLKLFTNNIVEKITDYFLTIWNLNHPNINGFFYYPKNKEKYTISYQINNQYLNLIITSHIKDLATQNQLLKNFLWAIKKIAKFKNNQ